jgi:hypothetical protein
LVSILSDILADQMSTNSSLTLQTLFAEEFSFAPKWFDVLNVFKFDEISRLLIVLLVI